MRLVLLALLAVTCVSTRIFDSSKPRTKRSTSEDGFDEKLKRGYDLLRNEPNADNTVRFLEQLHDMEKEMKVEVVLPAEENAEILSDVENYVEINNDHIQPMGDTIEEINQNSGVETALFQGDMLLTKEQTDEMMDDIKGIESSRNKRQAYRDRFYPKTLWLNGVYYSFYSNATEEAKRVFKKAAETWQSETCVSFTESNTAPDRILLIKEGGCWSNVGRIGGVQHLSLGSGCESVGTAAHEIGHALGFFHTQSRHDRDSFITLHTQNFMDGWLSQFTKQSERTNYNYNLTYDYGSVMHYGAKSVSKNREPVMVPRDVKYMQTLGSPMISFYDKLMMNLHYKCLDKCTVRTSVQCQNGGFPHPRDCSKCICPSGYGGRTCSERPSGCGKVLQATKSFQTLEDRVGGRTTPRTNDEFMMCNYWIQAPAGSTIEVVLDGYTKGVATDGCEYAGVEMKTGKDKRHTGYRFCSSNNIGTSLISTHNIVPIITYSEAREIETVLRYRIASSGSEIPPTEPGTCEDSTICTSLLKRDFCRSPKYDDNLRKLICPKSCGFC